MTTAIVVMIGAGILFVISAIENSSLVATFQAIWSGQPISSLAASGASGSPPSGTPKPPEIVPGGLQSTEQNPGGINKL